jgi:hypothetical protein
MRSAAIDSGSTADRLNGLAMLLLSTPDLSTIEYRWRKIVRGLETAATRAAVVRRRGGSVPGIDGAVRWLQATIRDHAALDEPGGQALRDELQALLRRIALPPV